MDSAARKTMVTILLRALAVAVAGGLVWVAVWLAGFSRDLAWTLAGIVWVIGSPVLDLIETARARKAQM